MMPEEQRWKRMGDVRGKILEAQVFELASLLSAWSRPSDSSQELHPKRCVILPSESAKLQRNRVIRGEGCSSSAFIQPANMSRTETDKRPQWISQEGSACRAGEAAAWSSFKDAAPVRGHPIYTNVLHYGDRGGETVTHEKEKEKKLGQGFGWGNDPMFEND